MFKYLTLQQDHSQSLSGLQKLVYAVVASFVITISAKISVPFYPVPTTMQPFAIILLGCLLGPRLAVASVMLYLAEAFAGLPVLQGPFAGPAAFVGPTAGYLVGFPIAAYICGVLYQNGLGRTLGSALLIFLIGALCFNIPGLLWLSVLTNPEMAQKAFISYSASTLLKSGLGASILLLVSKKQNNKPDHHHHHDKNS